MMTVNIQMRIRQGCVPKQPKKIKIERHPNVIYIDKSINSDLKSLTILNLFIKDYI